MSVAPSRKNMFNALQDRIASYLTHHQVCVISTGGPGAPCALPVRYWSHGLEVECLVPRWTDVAYALLEGFEAHPGALHQVMLIVLGYQVGELRWLQYRGTAQEVRTPDWARLLPARTFTSPPGDLYLVIRVRPQRIDLFDESQGWGARETLELDA